MPMPTTKAVTAAGYMTSDCLSEEFSRRRIYITGEICDALAAEALSRRTNGFCGFPARPGRAASGNGTFF